MLNFAWPWLLLLLPLPLLIRRLPPVEPRTAALKVPFLQRFDLSAAGSAATSRWQRPRGPLLVLVIIWLLLVLAASRPQWLDELVELPISGRDLMLAVDLSASMSMRDFEIGNRHVNRLEAIKTVANQFIDRREGDRLGLILFAQQAYLQVPLTFDHDTVKTLLNEAELGLAGRQTAIGDAIGMAVKQLRNIDAGDAAARVNERVLVLLTDGANTAGEIAPDVAAGIAARNGIRIFTVGVAGEPMLIQGVFGLEQVDPSAELDEELLVEIAETTGGRYFRARDTRELAQIYRAIDALAPIEQDPAQYRPRQELYPWPLAFAALFALGLFGWLNYGGRPALPEKPV